MCLPFADGRGAWAERPREGKCNGQLQLQQQHFLTRITRITADRFREVTSDATLPRRRLFFVNYAHGASRDPEHIKKAEVLRRVSKPEPTPIQFA